MENVVVVWPNFVKNSQYVKLQMVLVELFTLTI